MEGTNLSGAVSEKEVRTLLPGMSDVVKAGDTLVITATDGGEISIKGEESDEVMMLLKSLDDYIVARNANINEGIVKAMWSEVMRTFHNLPNELLRQLPSSTRAGITVPAPHNHG